MPSHTPVESQASEIRRVERVYGALARVYDGAFDWALGPGRRQAIESLPIHAGDRILEVGVGTGLSIPLYPGGVRVDAVDISEPMLQQARERAESYPELEVVLQRMDARDLSFADGTFDHVVVPYVMSVVPEPERVMREIHRVCRPGAHIHIVNHFESGNVAMAALERAVTPLSQWVGFRLNLPLGVVTQASGFTRAELEPVNLLGHWTLVKLRKAPLPDEPSKTTTVVQGLPALDRDDPPRRSSVDLAKQDRGSAKRP